MCIWRKKSLTNGRCWILFVLPYACNASPMWSTIPFEKHIIFFSSDNGGRPSGKPERRRFPAVCPKKKNLPRPQGGGSEGMTNNLFQTWPTHSYTDTHCQHRHWYYTHKQTTHGHIHTRYMQTKVPCRLKSILKPITDCWTICFPLTSLKFQIASEIVFKISQCRAREPQTCTRFFFERPRSDGNARSSLCGKTQLCEACGWSHAPHLADDGLSRRGGSMVELPGILAHGCICSRRNAAVGAGPVEQVVHDPLCMLADDCGRTHSRAQRPERTGGGHFGT